MITFQEHTGFIRVEEYGFAEWLAEVEKVINQGFKFDFMNNENYPVGYGSMYTAVLVPTAAQGLTEGEVNVPPSVTAEIPADTPEVQPSGTLVVEPVVIKRKNARG